MNISIRKYSHVTDSDIDVVNHVHELLQTMMHVPVESLEHAVQLVHESNCHQDNDPPEIFAEWGITRQTLRMFWHFRCNLESVMPQEDRG